MKLMKLLDRNRHLSPRFFTMNMNMLKLFLNLSQHISFKILFPTIFALFTWNIINNQKLTIMFVDILDF